MGKKFDETIKHLGDDYTTKVIDFEQVIYRNINSHEFEISGLNSNGKYDVTLYIWKNRQIVKTIQGIHSKEELAKHLDTVVQEIQSHLD